MYFLKPGIKKYPEKRWHLPDRIFFSFGACHILAGVFLKKFSDKGFYALRILPKAGFYGNHIFVTDGIVAFDFHGYSLKNQLIAHFRKGWSARYPGWDAHIEVVDFPLLDTDSLNQRKMLGPNQYLFNPIKRAEQFLNRFDHEHLIAKVLKKAC
ncbi:hypothetical protein KCM76_02855 [Zooshikella marina]|uniref:Uncharacterized protein n=1 Tax=Zooshikella ganghwensis TaxID=202772 RepID=A0A4P9VPB8_9GAMM|nr:hypothetical protein [Zooshikella ganghwensis]MBU2704901.1 hypothetical protein [Zooshikella ganghwensis]RDH45338.1 hypothetical protein B9G39_18825 [Zooshikella ganghwensis]